jgi:hypothetical protein
MHRGSDIKKFVKNVKRRTLFGYLVIDGMIILKQIINNCVVPAESGFSWPMVGFFKTAVKVWVS